MLSRAKDVLTEEYRYRRRCRAWPRPRQKATLPCSKRRTPAGSAQPALLGERDTYNDQPQPGQVKRHLAAESVGEPCDEHGDGTSGPCLPRDVSECHHLSDVLLVSLASALEKQAGNVRATRSKMILSISSQDHQRRVVTLPQVGSRSRTFPSPPPVPNSLMKPRFAMTEPPAPS